MTESGTIDWLLSTTRTVRKRLDLQRPVDIDVVRECLNLALQAPTGADLQGWRWVVVTDPLVRSKMRDIYVEAMTEASAARKNAGSGAADRIHDGAWHLGTHLDEVPVLVVACIRGGLTPRSTASEIANLNASIYPAVWSLQLALRSRGLVSALTTVHLGRRQAMAELLGIPDRYTQAALIPIAHLIGSELHPARRKPVSDVAFLNHWSRPWVEGDDSVG